MARLQKQLNALSQQKGIFDGDELIRNKLLKQAQIRLCFDKEDVHGSIRSWDYFFRLYKVESDYIKFLAVEQLLPRHIQRAMSVNHTAQYNYRWLVEYLKDRYNPKYLCHEMDIRTVDQCTNFNELEDLAAEAANCPKEELIKHFLLQSCTKYQREKMKPFLLFSMKDFRFKLRDLIQESVGLPPKGMGKIPEKDHQLPVKYCAAVVATEDSMLKKEVTQHSKQSILNQNKFTDSLNSNKCREDSGAIGKVSELKVLHDFQGNFEPVVKYVRDHPHMVDKRHLGMFCCDGCGRKWISRVGSFEVRKQCFNCNILVTPHCVRALGCAIPRKPRNDVMEEDQAADKNIDNCSEHLFSFKNKNFRCYNCGGYGHLARECAIDMEENSPSKNNKFRVRYSGWSSNQRKFIRQREN